MNFTNTRMATLLRSVPTLTTLVFIAAVIAMNFLARISLVSLPWISLNAGITVSWLSFLLIDILAKHYGVKAANLMSVLAITVNVTVCLLCSAVGHFWDHPALNMVVGGQWSILLASTLAYVISAATNNYTNIFIGKQFAANPDGKTAFAARSFVSTLLSQVVDNFLFVFLAFVVFPLIPGAFPVRWTLLQCLGGSVLCAFLELFSEMVFAPFGYHIVRKWKKDGVGKEYLDKYCPNGVLEG